MSFDDLLLEILDKFIENGRVDIEEYCKKYPQYKDALLDKFRTAEFIRKNLREEDLSGKKLGEYLILQELGRGGMGIVFLGIQPALSRLTAIKVLPPSFAQDKDALRNFQEEAKIIAKFNHPNIVPIYSISDERGMYYIAMGYISGLSLKSIVDILKINKNPGKIRATVIKEILQAPPAEKQDISQKSITLKRGFKFWDMPYFKFVATIGAEISDALSYAHQNSIIHGDLKPSNMLLTNEAIPMVLDFGLSQNIKKLASSKSTEFSGTLAYAAPEQIKNNTINEKTDIWSLGVTLYELLTFKNPFLDKTVKKTADRISKGNLTPLRTYNKKIPIELEAIILKCLENKPENRYGSISEVAQDLNNYLELRPIKAKPDDIIKRIQKAIRRKPWIAVLSFSLVFVFIPLFYLSINLWMGAQVQDINRLLNKGRISDAFTLNNKIAKLSNTFPSLFLHKYWNAQSNYTIGTYLAREKHNYKEAIIYFQSCVNLSPPSHTYDARVQLILCYDKLGLYDQALNEIKECLMLSLTLKQKEDIYAGIAMVIYNFGIKSYEVEKWRDYLKKKGFSESIMKNVAYQLTVGESLKSPPKNKELSNYINQVLAEPSASQPQEIKEFLAKSGDIALENTKDAYEHQSRMQHIMFMHDSNKIGRDEMTKLIKEESRRFLEQQIGLLNKRKALSPPNAQIAEAQSLFIKVQEESIAATECYITDDLMSIKDHLLKAMEYMQKGRMKLKELGL